MTLAGNDFLSLDVRKLLVKQNAVMDRDARAERDTTLSYQRRRVAKEWRNAIVAAELAKKETDIAASNR